MKVKEGLGRKVFKVHCGLCCRWRKGSRPGQHGHFNMIEENLEKEGRIKAGEEREARP